MNSNIYAGVVVFMIGTLFGALLWRWRDKSIRAGLENEKGQVLDAARLQAESITRDARLSANEEALKVRAETEQVVVSRHKEIAVIEQRLTTREELVNGQLERLVKEETMLRADREALARKSGEIEEQRQQAARLVEQRRVELAAVSKLSEQEVRAAFLKQVEQESMGDAVQLSQHVLEEAKVCAEEKARKIITLAIQRYAGHHSFETSTATVNIKGEEMKGRIIGREGRNIRAFEAATGVTVLIDDTPGAVVLSGFDPVRREVAREAMERLILDGRIHPARIEEVVAKVSQEMDQFIERAGEEAIVKLGVAPMHIELIRLLGRLHFRHSFAQNILQHSVEVAQLMAILASELRIDVVTAKRAGLLHDIGKAVNHEVEGSHAIVGAEIVKRYGESDEVVNAVASHHGEVPHTGVFGILVSAADAISASRPGARSETVTTYIKRVEDLERIGTSFPGVEKCFALQAGRELRVLVQPAVISDEQAYLLARNISRKIEEELQYPGQIRVTIVRETRCIEFAK
ncbi:MAG TPA: ribonuclease Y [Candidatus Baltobacteraceae bacterium]|jgi:ribonuclease Y|nr:ribonuclease Y [Candidatus Baltobacteraceae bacterium]